MGSVIDRKTELDQTTYKNLAPIFAQWMHALMECSDVVQGVVHDMVEIMVDPEADDEDKEMAKATFLEALFPVSHNGSLGADLEELEEEHRNGAIGDLIDEMDTEEFSFGEKVKVALVDRGMTQQQLAAAIGVGQPAVSMMLNREARPQLRTVKKIAEALQLSHEDLWPC